MNAPRLLTAAALAAGLALIGFALRPGPRADAAAVIAIRDVRVFDGERVLPRATVLVSGALIQAAGPDVAVPKDATVIEGASRTLLPGLIDSHTHVWGDALRRALDFGITTELDMFMDHGLAAQLRREQAEGRAAARADLRSAGTLVTAPGGHGTEYGVAIPTLERPGDADAFVAARLAEGSDYVKAVFDDGAAYGRPWPTLGFATLQEVVAAAHRRRRLAVVHVGSARGAEQALESGADGLVHLFGDAEPGPGFAALARRRGAFVIPTLTVIESLAGAGGGAKLAEDPRVGEWLSAAEKHQLQAPFPIRRRADAAIARRTAKQLVDAGVDVLAGSDAPNPGTAHGASLHRELELLVAAGLSPLQALRSATSVPARVFSLADRGRVRAGARADLLLVEGDPTSDVTATRAIAMVFKEGVRATRGQPAATAANPRIEDGRVSDFEEGGEPKARFGSGWHASTDDRMGGKSEVRLEASSPGAGGSKGALRIQGVVRAGSPYPWAGAMFFPGPHPSAPVDLSGFRALRFQVRGDGGSYSAMLFATRLGMLPAGAEFRADSEWRQVTLRLSAFGSVDGQGATLDGSDVWGLLFTAGAREGEFSFEIDDVAFVKEP
jgi:imidazolonepropionase-like amidohydrolase